IDMVPQTQNWWTEITVLLTDHITPSANTRFAFVATDYRSGSLVEAMVDDFGIYSYVSLDVVESQSKPEIFEIGIYPNPFNSAVKMDFGAVPRSISIFDINGRQVASPNPEKTVVWDAKNSKGEELPSGVYLIKVATEDGFKMHKITLLR
ncbi:MAG: T9SS type A sorting domain-containing protein, partial [bacterium]